MHRDAVCQTGGAGREHARVQLLSSERRRRRRE